MSTHTERCVSRKSSGRYGHGIRLNQVNFIAAARLREHAELLGVPFQVVLVPRLDVFGYDLGIGLGGHGPPSGLSRRFRTTNMRPGRVLLSIRPLAAVPRR